MITTIEAKDLVLEEWCDHRRDLQNRLPLTDPDAYWPEEDCPHCLGTGQKPTEIGLKVLEFVARNLRTHRV